MAANRSHVCVFVVDDDASVRSSLLRLLHAAGFDAVAFDTAKPFFEALRSGRAAKRCLVLDIAMPGVSGLELVERMRQLGIDMPVIALSATDDDRTRRIAKRLGAKLFFGKPVDDSALIDAIEWVVNSTEDDC